MNRCYDFNVNFPKPLKIEVAVTVTVKNDKALQAITDEVHILHGKGEELREALAADQPPPAT